MKKTLMIILAMLLALAMLLGACAFAEETQEEEPVAAPDFPLHEAQRILHNPAAAVLRNPGKLPVFLCPEHHAF